MFDFSFNELYQFLLTVYGMYISYRAGQRHEIKRHSKTKKEPPVQR